MGKVFSVGGIWSLIGALIFYSQHAVLGCDGTARRGRTSIDLPGVPPSTTSNPSHMEQIYNTLNKLNYTRSFWEVSNCRSFSFNNNSSFSFDLNWLIDFILPWFQQKMVLRFWDFGFSLFVNSSALILWYRLF